jgi:hypothetical protein
LISYIYDAQIQKLGKLDVWFKWAVRIEEEKLASQAIRFHPGFPLI